MRPWIAHLTSYSLISVGGSPDPYRFSFPRSRNLSSQGADSSGRSLSLLNIPYLFTLSYGFSLIPILHKETAKARLLFKIRTERSFAFAGCQQVKCVRKLQNLKCLRTFKKMMFKSSSDLGEPAKCWALCQVFAEGNPFCLVWRGTHHPLRIMEK